MLELARVNVTEIFSVFDGKGVTAEMVASTGASQTQDYLGSQAVASEHLTDQLLLPMALAGSGSFTAEAQPARRNEHGRHRAVSAFAVSDGERGRVYKDKSGPIAPTVGQSRL